MPEAERDSTQDWLVPAADRPVTMLELEQRVDVALAVAHSAEAAALEIGAAALDSAKQAQRAADLAERAVTGQAGNGVEAPVVENGVEPPPYRNGGGHGDERLRLFSERAERVRASLCAL
jgi:hypothetical protein